MDPQQFGQFMALQQQILHQTQNQNQQFQQQQTNMQLLVTDMTNALSNTSNVQQGQLRIQDAKGVQTLAQYIEEFKGEGFLDWKFRVENTARMRHVDLYQLLTWAEKMEEIIDYDATTTTQSDGYLATFKYFGTYFYNAFATKLKGEPFDIVRNVGEQNGAEVWRKLCKRYHGKTFGKKLHMTRKVVNPGKIKKLSEATNAVEKWEGDLTRLKRDFGIDIEDDLKTAVMLEMMPQTITEIMVQRIKADDEYKDVKENLMRYVETREDFDGIRPMDTNHVQDKEEEQKDWEDDDIDWIGKGGGKGGKGGKGQGPKGGCWQCGGPHYAENCPQGKGKGKGETRL